MLPGDKPENAVHWVQSCVEAMGSVLIDGYVPQLQPAWLHLAFCTPCLNRAAQMLVSLPVNLLFFWGLQERGGWCIAAFGDDVDLVRRVKGTAQRAVDVGLLHIASGGKAADVYRQAAGEAEPPAGSSASSSAAEVVPPAGGASSSGEAAPPGTAGRASAQNSQRLPKLEFWRSCFAKNSAHMFAVDKYRSRTSLDNLILVNLDCDNIASNDFAEAVMKSFHELPQPDYACVSADGCTSALTGRLCYRASDFLVLGGYDQEAGPTGHQDTDLRQRLTLARKQRHGLAQPARLKGPQLCGGALPNDPTSWKRDRNQAKIENVAPDIKAGKSWADLRKTTKDKLSAKTEAGKYVRNEDVRRLGSWFVELDLRSRPGEEAAPSPAVPTGEALPSVVPGATAKAPTGARASGSGEPPAKAKPPSAAERSRTPNKIRKTAESRQSATEPAAEAVSRAESSNPPTRTLELPPLPRRKFVNPLVELDKLGIRKRPCYVDLVSLGLRLLMEEKNAECARRPRCCRRSLTRAWIRV